MSASRLVLPVALGLSIVTVSAFVVYYILKKDEDKTEIRKKEIKSSKMNIIEIKVPKSIVPALIGRSGSNIKDIESKSGAMINFKKFTDAEYDVCMIRGRSQATQLAEMLVREFINEQPVLVNDSLVVPVWAVGKIIGSQGSNINDICHRSGARVKVEGAATDKSSERLVTFLGTKEQIEVAKELINNSIAQEKCRREIKESKSPRAPRSHSPSPAPSPAPETEPAGPCIEVYVSAVSSPSRFWVQFVGPQVAQLDELVEHMTEYYSNKENRANHALSHVSVGQVVAAVFRHDGKWYRARVHDIRPNEFDPTKEVADLFFLDYGDSEYVATHELCELRADLLRLRFQAMECFLAGVRPADSADAENVNKWPSAAVERFEELVQVARWKPLVSRTCTYKKTSSAEGEKEKEIPGIKLYDATDEGELDIGGVLILEGHAIEGGHTEHASPAASSQPFGDLGSSRVLGMLSSGGARASSLPKDHKDDRTERKHNNNNEFNTENDKKAESRSLASGLEKSDRILSISNYDITLDSKPHVNGSTFLDTERLTMDAQNASSETLTPKSEATPKPEGLTKIQREECKANMNRIDSHHSNLEALGRMHEF